MSVVVSRPFEDDHGDVADLPAERLGDPAEVLGRGGADVDLAGRDRSDAQLLHVRVGRVGEAAGLGCREDGDGAGLAVGDEVGALERVHRDVDPRDVVATGPRPTDTLADVEHRRLVTLALADHDPPGEVDLVHRPAHRLGRGGVGGILLAATHEPRRLDRRRLGHPDHLQREQLFHGLWSLGRRLGWTRFSDGNDGVP